MLSQYEKVGRNPIRILHKGTPLNPEANLFVKNIDPAVTHKELHNYFSKCGPVVLVKIASDKASNSLGYGYVQFEKPEDANKAIEELNNTQLKEQQIGVEKFKSKDTRDVTTNNNLYVKHLPEGKSQEEIEKLLNVTAKPSFRFILFSYIIGGVRKVRQGAFLTCNKQGWEDLVSVCLL